MNEELQKAPVITPEERQKQIEDMIERLDSKDFGIYFFTLDTRGNPVAGVANIYEHVKVLTKLGYRAYILHEKNDYKLRGDEHGFGLSDWLGEEYANLPHISIENQTLNLGPHDVLVVPEVFTQVMQKAKTFNCMKVILSQSYSYLFELLPIGGRWTDYGFKNVITTSETQANYLHRHFPGIITHIIPVSIADYFKASEKPKMPVVCIHTRTQGLAHRIAKSFYLQYPIYKWISFKELRGLPKRKFAEELGQSCLSIWVDDESGFGTFPLESIQCDTPVIGKIPNMIPEWLQEKDESGNFKIRDNGIWTNTLLNIPELVATYLKLWFDDIKPEQLFEAMNETKNLYTEDNQAQKNKRSL